MSVFGKNNYICQKFTEMNCNVHKLNLCFLKQETPINPTFKFNTDISNDSFTYTVKNYNIGQTVIYGIGSGISIVDNNTIEIEIPIDQMVIGSYSHELLWENADGIKRVVFQGILKVSETGEYCADCQTNIGEFDVNIINDEVVVNIVLGSAGSGNVLGIIPNWTFLNATKSVIKKSILFIDENVLPDNDVKNVRMLSRRQNLDLKIIGFDAIKNDNPKIIIERYRPSSKGRLRYLNEDKTAWIIIPINQKGGFVQQKNPIRISEIPIIDENMLNVDFSQETYFRAEKDGNVYTHRGFIYKGKPIFQFRIKTDKGISPPLLKLGLMSANHNNWRNFWTYDEVEEILKRNGFSFSGKYLQIGYAIL